VAFQLLECFEAQRAAGAPITNVALVGGGARSRLWLRMVASLFDRPMAVPQSAALAAPIGAARLAAVAATGSEALPVLARAPRVLAEVEPQDGLARLLRGRLGAWRRMASGSLGEKDCVRAQT
jgi:xylulokinase